MLVAPPIKAELDVKAEMCQDTVVKAELKAEPDAELVKPYTDRIVSVSTTCYRSFHIDAELLGHVLPLLRVYGGDLTKWYVDGSGVLWVRTSAQRLADCCCDMMDGMLVDVDSSTVVLR